MINNLTHIIAEVALHASQHDIRCNAEDIISNRIVKSKLKQNKRIKVIVRTHILLLTSRYTYVMVGCIFGHQLIAKRNVQRESKVQR